MKKLYILPLLILIFNIGSAQKFWLTTYEFPAREKTGIAGIGDTYLFAGFATGVLRSSNEGVHWDTVFFGSPVYSLYANNNGLVLAGGAGKIYASKNSGISWDSATINTAYPVIKFVEDKDGGLYAINGTSDINLGYVGGGIYYSSDKGASWIQRNQGLGSFLSCDQLACDRNGRLYLAARDENVSGSGGLFISENNGLQWEHIAIKVDGENAIEDDIKINYSTGLDVSVEDTLYYSFDGVSGTVGVRFNLKKSINDIRSTDFWNKMRTATGPSWWSDKLLNGIHFARNGDYYSSVSGSTVFGGTFFSKDKGQTWSKHNEGLGLTTFGDQGVQTFYEKSSGKVFMVQYLDERIYWADTSIITHIPVTEIFKASVFPNPVPCQSKLTLMGLESGNYVLEIVDMQGKLIYTTETGGSATIQSPSMPGVYILNINSGRQSFHSRLVVQ